MPANASPVPDHPPAGAITVLRSAVFAAGQALTTVVFALIALAMFAFPHRLRYKVVTLWTRINIAWLALACGLKHHFEGLENVPRHAAVVLSKHQSAWETMALQLIFDPQVWVVKKELLRVPFFGWGLAMLKPIAIDRSAGRDAVTQVKEQGRERLRNGFWVVIFPEGTRVAPGAKKRYKPGGAILAEYAGVPIVPVAHNAGDFWPRNSFLKRPGVIRLVVGPPIEPRGRDVNELNALAEDWIESTCAGLRQSPTTEEPLT